MLLIANPRAASGRARGRWDALLAGLHHRGLQPAVCLTDYPRHAEALAREAAPRYDVVVAVGGDGTVSEVASGILLSAAPETPLGILPLGTGNDVARLLGLTTSEAALAALAGEQIRRLDAIAVRSTFAGETREAYALLYASVGFAGELLRRITPLVKRLCGPYAYSVGFFRALWSFQTPTMQITLGDEQLAGRYFFACAGNAEWTGGGTMRLSPGARMDDGLLDLCLVKEFSRLEILKNFPRLLAGTHVELPTVCYRPGTALSVSTDTPFPVALDGDLFGETPVEFRVAAGAVRVLAM
jgi:YegS/Rv2252/BmrU family lipid kinase